MAEKRIAQTADEAESLVPQIIYLKKEVKENRAEIVELRAKNQALEKRSKTLEMSLKEYSNVMTDKIVGYKKRIAELETQLKNPSKIPAQGSHPRSQALEVSRKQVWFGQEVPVVYAPLSSLDENRKLLTEEEFKEWLDNHKGFKILKMTEYI